MHVGNKLFVADPQPYLACNKDFLLRATRSHIAIMEQELVYTRAVDGEETVPRKLFDH